MFMKKIVTHNAKFHTDDVFAVASLLILYPEALVTRTREEKIIGEADMVVDVGGAYNADRNRFDHHQIGGAGKRENGIQFASFGLVWKKFGAEIAGSREVKDKIDHSLVQLVDAADNGQDVITASIPDILPFTINRVIDQYRATWKEVESWDERFMEAVSLAQKVITREIKIVADMLEGAGVVEKIFYDSPDKRVVVVDEQYDFGRELVMNVLVKFSEPIYAVLYRSDTRSWQVLAIKKSLTTFESRKPLPESWRAKVNADFENVSGVPGALFCHRSGFMCTASSKEGALKLAKFALNV